MAQKETAKVSFYFKMDMVENKTVQMDKKRVGRDMSILIKGMEMPKSCFYCPMREWHIIHGEKITSCKVAVMLIDDEDEKPNWCPLIEIPPHGRLIDADALRLSHCVECTLHPDKCLKDECDWGSIYHIDHATTIIPADKDGEK